MLTSTPARATSPRFDPVDVTVAAVATLAFVALMVATAVAGPVKVVVVGLFSFVSMVVGALLASRVPHRAAVLQLVEGLAAGAMVASASAFLVPTAINQSARAGGFGIALGLLLGYLLHRRVSSTSGDTPVTGGGAHTARGLLDDEVIRLSIHAFGAGIVIGAIYTALPGVGVLLGLTIVSHKGPAGYAAARRLHDQGRSALALAVPAVGIGIPAAAIGLLGPTFPPIVSGLVFGAAAGVFLHLALDHLPERHIDREGGGSDGEADDEPDRTARAGLTGVLAGAVVVVVLWAITQFV